MKLKSIMKPRVPVVEAGSYLAVCVGVVFLGGQYVPPYGDRKGRYENQLMFVWDLPSELDENGVPKQLNRKVNATNSSNGNLMSIMSSWNGRTYTRDELAEIEVNDQLGKPCMLSVSVRDSGFANVTAVSAIPKGIPAPVSTTPYIKFDVNVWSDEEFAALPDWVQEKIKNSSEYQKLHVPTDPIDVDIREGQDQEQAQKEENPI